MLDSGNIDAAGDVPTAAIVDTAGARVLLLAQCIDGTNVLTPDRRQYVLFARDQFRTVPRSEVGASGGVPRGALPRPPPPPPLFGPALPHRRPLVCRHAPPPPQARWP